MDSALALLRSSGPTAAAESARFGLVEAAAFAGRVEELSRTVEYLQLIAAAAVDRTRKESASSAPRPSGAGWGTEAAAPGGWLTGWKPDPDAGSNGGTDTGTDPGTGPGDGPSGPAVPAALCVAADDGYRNTAEFLRARLRISAPEARRRLRLATELLPGRGLAGQPVPAVHEELATAVASGDVGSHAATIITTALDRVRHLCLPETAAAMDHALTRTAVENDPDFLARIARRWTEGLDQDGAEPSEEVLRRLQGAFLRKPRHGLQHLEIFATTEQYEHLATVMNTATNPRTGTDTSPGAGANAGTVVDPADGAGVSAAAGAADALDRRSRPQRLLDGLVGACKAALATGGLPAAGGLRPQVMATIDYRDLARRLRGQRAPATRARER